LQLDYDEQLSKFAFKFNFRRYNADVDVAHSGHGKTPLGVAVRLGHVDVVEVLIGRAVQVEPILTPG